MCPDLIAFRRLFHFVFIVFAASPTGCCLRPRWTISDDSAKRGHLVQIRSYWFEVFSLKVVLHFAGSWLDYAAFCRVPEQEVADVEDPAITFNYVEPSAADTGFAQDLVFP